MGYKWIECRQGDDQWTQSRLGRGTGSCLHKIMAKGRAGDSFGSGATEYATDLIIERLTRIPQDSISTRETEWGMLHEDGARVAYGIRKNIGIDEVGFAISNEQPSFGVSVDGLVGDDGTIEIKCPYSSANHLKYLRFRKVPRDYYLQIQGGLWVLDRKWCDFVSYDPRMPSGYDLSVVRVERDEREKDTIAEIADRCKAFALLVAEISSSLKEMVDNVRK